MFDVEDKIILFDLTNSSTKPDSFLYVKSQMKQIKEAGVYFLRTNIENLDEPGIWNTYNILREVESGFRILKTDLSLRPVYHQSDENSGARIFPGVFAYTIVNTVRYQLKAHNIRHDWQNFVRIMNTQKLVTTTMLDKCKRRYTSEPVRVQRQALSKFIMP
mgnify:CR=1 FL=1